MMTRNLPLLAAAHRGLLRRCRPAAPAHTLQALHLRTPVGRPGHRLRRIGYDRGRISLEKRPRAAYQQPDTPVGENDRGPVQGVACRGGRPPLGNCTAQPAGRTRQPHARGIPHIGLRHTAAQPRMPPRRHRMVGRQREPGAFFRRPPRRPARHRHRTGRHAPRHEHARAACTLLGRRPRQSRTPAPALRHGRSVGLPGSRHDGRKRGFLHRPRWPVPSGGDMDLGQPRGAAVSRPAVGRILPRPDTADHAHSGHQPTAAPHRRTRDSDAVGDRHPLAMPLHGPRRAPS